MVILAMYRRRSVQERAVQKWPGNAILIFRKNITALKELNELVDELAQTCTYVPAGFDKSGIRQHILDTLNERRRRIHNGHDYEKVYCFKSQLVCLLCSLILWQYLSSWRLANYCNLH